VVAAVWLPRDLAVHVLDPLLQVRDVQSHGLGCQDQLLVKDSSDRLVRGVAAIPHGVKSYHRELLDQFGRVLTGRPARAHSG